MKDLFLENQQLIQKIDCYINELYDKDQKILNLEKQIYFLEKEKNVLSKKQISITNRFLNLFKKEKHLKKINL